ncbi:protein ENDOSPERM DEFECTIVE 1 isoform X2 [Gossypium hirsutum]|uniref:Protein ENDOSPERM DEFECTIVE 1 isoform X2 n=1 Tax=Gossypium hirsutum TaxID=3635 RepID=A0ABM2ZDF1_GOSHI|nr:protein ENDOSPERM DEFECTIVE 1 isoform X2 [Gossypium hirsutum]
MKGKSAKVTPFSLPPVPSHTKHGTDTIRGSKKISRHQEDLHSLKLLYNCYLQWRFANAKAENSTQIQKRETERILYSLEVKISELYDRVRRKRMELQLLQRMKTLSNILQRTDTIRGSKKISRHQEDLHSLKLLYNCYLQGRFANAKAENSTQIQKRETERILYSLEVKISELYDRVRRKRMELQLLQRMKTLSNILESHVDTREVGEAMTSAIKMMEMIVSNVQSFMPKAEEMESSVSELARVAIGERAVIEECGDLLYKTNTFQVEECSLRAQLIQLQAMGSCNNKLLLQE